MRPIKNSLLVIFVVLLSASFSQAETKIGSTVESRVTLAFNVNDRAAQAFLPQGWKLLTLPKGPIAGANLLVAFIDKHLARDAEGKPLNPHASRTVAIVSFGVKKGIEGARMFVTRTYETPPVVNPYENSVSAEITRNASLDGSENMGKKYKEIWKVKPDSGGELALELSYQSARPNWRSSQAMPYSNRNPDFHRIYSYDQLGELVMSKDMGKNLNGKISFKSSIPELADMLDGTENLVGVVAIPVYVRQIALP